MEKGAVCDCVNIWSEEERRKNGPYDLLQIGYFFTHSHSLTIFLVIKKSFDLMVMT
jgi:hypothetical protein